MNPYYFYNKPDVKLDETLTNGFLTCVETFYHGELERQEKVINHEFRVYQDKLGFFGKPYALRGCEQNTAEFDLGCSLAFSFTLFIASCLYLCCNWYSVEHWWSMYGCSVGNLAILARKILSLTSCSTGCQRNWITFQEVCAFVSL